MKAGTLRPRPEPETQSEADGGAATTGIKIEQISTAQEDLSSRACHLVVNPSNDFGGADVHREALIGGLFSPSF